jgi:2-iminobutanoate/2-iminopropanoate deaminase
MCDFKAGFNHLDLVYECQVLMTNLSQYSELNTEYAKHFTGPAPPARAAYEVVALPKGVLTEIKCSAAL